MISMENTEMTFMYRLEEGDIARKHIIAISLHQDVLTASDGKEYKISNIVRLM